MMIRAWNKLVAWLRSKNITTHTVGGFIVAFSFAYTASPALRDYIGSLLVEYPVVVTKIGVLAVDIVGGVTLWRNYSHSSSAAGLLANAREIVNNFNITTPTAAQVNAADVHNQ